MSTSGPEHLQTHTGQQRYMTLGLLYWELCFPHRCCCCKDFGLFSFGVILYGVLFRGVTQQISLFSRCQLRPDFDLCHPPKAFHCFLPKSKQKGLAILLASSLTDNNVSVLSAVCLKEARPAQTDERYWLSSQIKLSLFWYERYLLP